MNLAGLDMYLVLALRALLADGNVTRAGERIGLSQPAMSRPRPGHPVHTHDAGHLWLRESVAAIGAEIT